MLIEEIKNIANHKKYWGLVLLFLFFYTILHIKAGITFPLPFGDETAFYYPAKVFCENNNLLAESINSKREVFWMPSGFMIFSGLVFKITGPSLIVGRWISFAFASLSFLLFALIIAKHTRYNLYSLAILGLCFISRHWVYIGNMMRMDMMMLFIALSGLYLVYNKKFLIGIAIGIFALLFHPNALYFILLSLIYEIFIYRCHNILPSLERKQVLPSLVPISFVLAYIIHVFAHLEFFISDWKFQFSTRNSEGLEILLFRWDQLIFTSIFLTTLYFILKFKKEMLLFILLIAAFLWTCRVMGQAHSYSIFRIIAVGLTCVVIHQLVLEFSTHLDKNKIRWLSFVSFLILCVGMFAGKVINMPTQKGMVAFSFLMPDWNESYYEKGEIETIGNKINQLSIERPYIYFVPASDGILFDPLPNKKWVHRLNIFDTVRYDAFVVHSSRFDNFENVFTTLKENYPEFEAEEIGNPIYESDSTEKWYFVKNKSKK